MYILNNLRAKLKNNDLLKHNAIFFVGTMLISAFNYLYYPVLGRLVSVSDFGEIQAVISIFMQLGIILTAFGYVITNVVGNTHGKQSRELILKLEQIMVIASIVGLLLLTFLASNLKSDLKLSSILPILLVGLLVVVNVPSTARAYILQGEKHLKEVSIAGIVYALGKLIVSVALIYMLTNDVLAAVLGYIVAQVLMLWYVAQNTKQDYVSVAESFSLFRSWRISKEWQVLIRKEIIYGVVIMVILSGLTLLYSSDTILARLFFAPHELGLYSAVASIARIIFFITASVAGVLVATVRINAPAKDNHSILLKSLLIVTAIGGICTLLFALAPKLFVTILVGHAYLGGAQWLPLLSVMIFVCAINNLLATYQIALRKYLAIIPVVLGMIVCGIGLAYFHANFYEFITVLLVANLVTGVLLSIEVLVEKKRGTIDGEGSVVGRPAEL
jgi:O-antigen/teichoic acid export membrane protein